MVDELDLKILKVLRKDARLSYRKIAEELKVATGTIQNRIQKMEQEGIITDYHAGVNLNKLGYNIAAIIGVCIDRKEATKIEKKLINHTNVFAVYSVTGEYDLFVATRFKTMNELNNFIRKELSNNSILKTNTFIILNISKETFSFLDK